MAVLGNKVAAVFAASGAVAGGVSRALARHGARVHVSARRMEAAELLAELIRQHGGWAQAHCVDAMVESQVDAFLGHIAASEGHIDAVFNGIGVRPIGNGYGTPTTDLPFQQFLAPIEVHVGSQFLTSRTAAKYMMQTKSAGTILTLSASLSRLKMPFMAGVTAACCAIEGLTRVMAAEFGKTGIRVICLNASGMPETRTIQETSICNARTMGISVEQFVEMGIHMPSLLGRALTVNDVAEAAAFLVSDAGAVFNSHVVDADFGTMNVI